MDVRKGEPERGKAHRTESELAYDRLQHLYEISMLLTRFESVDRTIPAVIALVAQTLPVKSSIFLLETEEPGKPRAIVWQRDGESGDALTQAQGHAERSYAYLVSSDVDLDLNIREAELLLATSSKRNYLLLPLVAEHGGIFGALQIEGMRRFEEHDLGFVDAVVNQVAIAVDRQAMLDARQQAFEYARDVTASIGDGVIATDLERRITLFNAAAEQLLGCKADDALGKPVQDIIRVRRANGTVTDDDYPFGTVMREGQTMGSDDSLACCPERTPFPISYTCAPLRRDDKVTGAVLAFRDIMDVQLAEKKQRVLADLSAILAASLEYRQTLSAIVRFAVPLLADACFIDEVRQNGTARRLEIVFADEHKQRHLAKKLGRYCVGPGWDTPQSKVIESAKALMFADIADPAGVAHDADHAEVIREAGLRSMLVVPLIARGRTLGALTFAAAESERHYSSSDLDLAEEIAHRAALALDNARLFEEAQSATRSRDELLAVVSHDLKNPIGAILMGASMMLDTFDSDDGSPWKRRIASIQHAAQRMDRLIRDLLDTATIDAGRLSIEVMPVHLHQLVLDSLETFTPLASRKSICVKSELNGELPAVSGDPDRLEQVLANLLGNALKFTHEGGQITIGAECTDRSVIVSITDNGPGMGQDELDHLFDRFWQARQTAALGNGLGLFIVKGIVETHGGSVWVESTLGVGSTFFVELPRASPQLTPAKERPVERDGRAVLAARAAHTVAKRRGQLRSGDMVVISKELRGPLTALELLTERLQRSRHTPPSPEQQRIVRRMFAALTRMTAAVESILQYGRIQADQLSAEIESFDLVALVREVTDQLRPCADEKSIELCVSAPRRVSPLRSDRELVRLIVLNLVDNAIKVTDRGLVSIFVDSAADGHHLAVVDAGPGIPPDQRVRIFEPFTKAANAKLKFVPGIGLGLTLVRDLAMVLGGRVQLDSEVGCGTTFTVILPPASETVEVQQLPFH